MAVMRRVQEGKPCSDAEAVTMLDHFATMTTRDRLAVILSTPVMLPANDTFGFTLLVLLLHRGHCESAKWLLNIGVCVVHMGAVDDKALAVACWCCSPRLPARGSSWFTPLYTSLCQTFRKDMVQPLYNAGAHPNEYGSISVSLMSWEIKLLALKWPKALWCFKAWHQWLSRRVWVRGSLP
jgi:hypothetical protein